MKLRRLALTLAAVLLCAAPAAQAATTTTVPTAPEARSFATSAAGWTSAVAFNNPCVGPLCPTATPEWVATGGAAGIGDGYLRTQVTSGLTVANDTRVTWSSPTFVAPRVDAATLSVAVRSSLQGLFSLRGDTELRMTITDVAAGTSTHVSTTTLTSSTSFSAITADVPANTFVAGRSYRVELRVRVTGGVATVVQSGTVGLDDVSLKLTTLQAPTAIAATASTSSGVSVRGSVDTNALKTGVVIQYGPTAAYGTNSNSVVLPEGGGVRSFDIALSGLTVGETYHYRAYAINVDGTAATADGTFVAPATPMNAPPTINGSGGTRVRTVVYDRVPGTTDVRIEVLDARGAVVGTFPDGDLDGTRTVSLPDADGTYGVRVVRTAGTDSATSATIPIVLDRVPPSTANLGLTVAPVSSRDLVRSVTFNVPGDVVSAEAQVLAADGTPVGAPQPATGGRASVQLGSADGSYRVRLTLRDVWGNAAEALSAPVTLDRTAPTAGGPPAVDGALNQRTRTIRFTRDATATSVTVEVLDGGGDLVGSTSVLTGDEATISLPDSDGTYAVRVRQSDVVGNVSVTTSTTTTLDRVPPTAGSAPAVTGAISDRTRTVAFTRNPGTVTAKVETLSAAGALVGTVSVPAGATTAITLPDADGTYSVRVRVADVAGNEAITGSTRITLDRSAPAQGAAPVVNGAANTLTRVVRFVRGGNTATATVLVRNDLDRLVVTQVVPGTESQVTLPAADGRYFVRVQQDDGAGTVTLSPAREIELDTTPPDAGPAPTVAGAPNSRARTVRFTRPADVTYALVEVVDTDGHLVSATTAEDASATVVLPDVDGDYRVRMRQYDGPGNAAVTPAVTVTLDRQPPAVGGPPTVTGARGSRTRYVVFSRPDDAAVARIEVLDETGEWRANFTVPGAADETSITLPDMDADYVVRVRQSDAAGNAAVTGNTRVTLLRGTSTDGDGNDTSGSGGDDSPDPTTGTGTDGGDTGTTDPGPGGGGPTTPVSVPTLSDPGRFGALLGDCFGGSLALTDVRATGRTVAISGLTAFAPGTAITIRDGRGRAVATAAAGVGGRFAASAALPAKGERASTTYSAVVGSTVSKAMKLTRATVIDALSVTGRTAQLNGTIKGAKAGKQLKVTVRGGRGAGACRAGGKTLKLDGRLKHDRRTGAFSVRVKLPKGSGRIALRVAVSGGLKSASAFVVR